ncbi:MAG: lysophospholipid acyltransferase family protein [Elusimicrobia bacterium]|nr:lysophospholipid acyltransferase family protein [Elusimicrobiota bacterium]
MERALRTYLKRFRCLLEYAALRLLCAGVARTRWNRAQRWGELLGEMASYLMASERRRALQNLAMVFPRRSPGDIHKLARSSWRNLGMMVTEFMQASRLSAQELWKNMTVLHEENLQKALAQGRGVLVHYGHFPNWELIGLGMSAKGYPVGVIAQTLGNPYLDRWSVRLRSRFGETVFERHSSLSTWGGWLRKNGILAVLTDQRVRRGMTVPFLGHLAQTSTFTALLAFKYRSPIVPLRSWREGQRIIFDFDPPLHCTREHPELSQDIRAWVVRLNRHLENSILAHPESWLWMHHRWKRHGPFYVEPVEQETSLA